MANRAFAVSPVPALLAGLLLATLGLGALWAVWARADGTLSLNTADWSAIRFTVMQAALSALVSLVAAIPVARALARRQFGLRRVLVLLMGAPFVMPVIVAVLGFVAVFGRAGWISEGLGLFGLPPVSIYGLHGVVLAHVFFNLPLATRLILQGWQAVPPEQMRLAESLRFQPRDMRRLIERPMLDQVLPGAFFLIFLICTTSFAVALVLGGGPRATTVELAIYQAFRFEFDLGHAAGLALVQLAIGVAAAVAAFVTRPRLDASAALGTQVVVPAPKGRQSAVFDAVCIAVAAGFLILPLLAVAAAGVMGLADLTSSIFPAIARSLAVAAVSVLLSLSLALALLHPVGRARARGEACVEGAGFLVLSISPLVVGTGLFLMINPVADPVALALPITAVVNAVLALPFVMQILLPPIRQAEAEFGPLADQLGLTGWARWRWLRLPRLERPLGFAAGLAGALSLGDLGVIALFADPARPTLPLYVYQLMGSYRTDAAAGAALVLLVLSLAIFGLLDRRGRA